MNKQALFHQSDSTLAFPIDESTIKIRLKADKNDNFDYVYIKYGCKYDGDVGKHKKLMKITFSDTLYSYYEVTLKLKDVRLSYYFEIYENGQKYIFTEEGILDNFDMEYAFYHLFQFPYINKNDITKQIPWTKSAVFYQIFVDRFYSSQKENKTYINLKWGDLPSPHSFAGGDLNGIKDKLDYIKSLGINVIYLTPIFKSDSNHKYNISDYEIVDSQFRTNQDFEELVNEIHSRNMKIVLDAVFNHASNDILFFKDAQLNKDKSKYKDWFIFKDSEYKEYEKFAHVKGMAKWNTSCKEVQEYLIKIGTMWIKKYHIDGWRLDVSDEVSHDFWRSFRKAIKEVNPNVILIGENWHDAHSFLRGDQFDSIMNYYFTKCVVDLLISNNHDANEVSLRLQGLYLRNIDPISNMMLNLLDSHDTHRFINLVHGNKNKLLQALAMLIYFPGMPCIYYGTEIPLEGGYDPDSRRCFPWDRINENKEYVKHFKKILKLKKYKRFDNGLFKTYSLNNLLIMERTLGKTTYRLIINSDNPQEYNSHGVIIDTINYENNILNGDGYIIEVIKND